LEVTRGFVKRIVFDAPGHIVETLVNEKQQAGTYGAEWNASEFPSGVYFCRLSTDDFKKNKRLVPIR
jgi:hypothetical protein